MADSKQLGDLIDKLGVCMTIGEGDMVTDVMVVAKIVDADGTVIVGVAASEGCSWLDQLGLIKAADGIIGNGQYVQAGRGED